jgi:2-polyprenyl-6-methoxyphenol hydroxylase-like FAD-dependent oxidoreductase
MTKADVVVVGGGIGGASLATALARDGVSVTVLEAAPEFEDRVRGESMQAWGVKEARDLGVEQIMLDAGAHVTPVWRQYSAGSAETRDIPMAMMVPEIPGSLNLRHPIACQALLDAAAAAGATVVRSVRDVALAAGSAPRVSYGVNGTEHEIDAGLVVGADGRASTVRRQVGIKLEKQEAISCIAGLLIDGLADVPDDHDVMVGEGEVFFLLFHQGGGQARVYVCLDISELRRFSGREGTRRFLDACALSAYPWSTQVVSATPAGPCATYPGDDTWTDLPAVDGVVLIGDAAGHNDPVIGQGLSIAVRDARLVHELVLDGARSAADFAPYGEERAERMRRLRLIADVVAVAQAEEADNRDARRAQMGEWMATMDPEVFPLVVGCFAGPDTVPDELVDPTVLDRLRAAS